jgi:hypothetical protein
MPIPFDPAESSAKHEGQMGPTGRHIHPALLVLVAFVLYWFSSNIIQSRDQVHLFNADTGMYWELAKGNVVARLGADPWLDRITRFHPVTTGMAIGWMKIFSPLTQWITPHQVLKAMFTAVGAIGVWAAMWAFAAVVPRRYVTVLGVIYATSLGVWYFASIEESKIVTATLTAIYIATYLHLRKRWTMRGAVLLTAVLLFACLNEIIAGFLVIIPMVDTLMQRGWDLRHSRWIAWHGLAAPIALAFLEGVVNGHVVAGGRDPEGASHLSMLGHYIGLNDFSSPTAYSFFMNWLFFNIAAPTFEASYVLPVHPGEKYFEPVLTNYFASPVTASLVALFGVMLVAILLPRYRANTPGSLTAILGGLGAYALVRGTFFLIVYPKECLLYASGITLVHMLMIGIPFTASNFPAKQGLLVAFALLLVIINGTFIIGA